MQKEISCQINFKEVVLKVENDKLVFEYWDASPIHGRIKHNGTKTYKIYKKWDGWESKLPSPYLDLSKDLNDEQAQFLEELIKNIMTRKYPNPKQTKELLKLPSLANTPFVQCILKLCDKYGCLCPLAFSDIGCIDYLEEPIEPSVSKWGGMYLYRPKQMMLKKSIMQILPALRQHISWNGMKKIYRWIREREEVEEGLVRAYGESPEMGEYG